MLLLVSGAGRKPSTLPPPDYGMLPAARRVVEGSLSLVPGDSLVVVADQGREDVASALQQAALLRGVSARVFVLEDYGRRPLSAAPAEVLDALEDTQGSAFAASAEPRELELRRQVALTATKHGASHAHMVGITARVMTEGMSVDPQRIAAVALALRARLRPDSVIKVSKGNAVLELRADARHRWSENSGSIRPGSWANLPAGELMSTPATATGEFVADASVTETDGLASGRLDRHPLTLSIRDGLVTGARCTDEPTLSAVRSFLRSGDTASRIGLMSFGTNPGLNGVTGHIIADQALPGLHLVLGTTNAAATNATWDGPRGLVLTAGSSNVDIDGEPILRAGRYLIR